MSSINKDKNLREITLLLQISKSMVIDTTYNMHDISAICSEIFYPYNSDGFKLFIKDFEVSSLEKINVSNTLDFYKSNLIIVKPNDEKLLRNNHNKISDEYHGFKENQDRKILNDILTKLNFIKESLMNVTSINNNTLKISNGFDKKNFDQNEFSVTDAFASTKDLTIKELSTIKNLHGSNSMNLNLALSIDNNSKRNNFFPPSTSCENNQDSFNDIKENKGKIMNKKGFSIMENKVEDLSINNLTEKINNEISLIDQINSENFIKKEKLKKNLMKSQDMINKLKLELENSFSKINLYENMLPRQLSDSQSIISNPNLNQIRNINEKERIFELEKYIKSLTDLNFNLKKSLKDYEEHTNELQKIISMYKSKDINKRISEDGQKKNCLCELKNEEILNLKKVIDELIKKCDEYELKNLKEVNRSLNDTSIEPNKTTTLQDILKITIEKKDILIHSLKSTESNMSRILSKYKEDLIVLLTYLKENHTKFQKTYFKDSSKNAINVNKLGENILDILKMKEDLIQDVNTNILNMNSELKELVQMNHEISVDLKKVCFTDFNYSLSSNLEKFKYQLNLIMKSNDNLGDKNSKLFENYQINTIKEEDSIADTNNIINEKLKELEEKLRDRDEDLKIAKMQIEIYKGCLEVKSNPEICRNQSFTLLNNFPFKLQIYPCLNMEIKSKFLNENVNIVIKESNFEFCKRKASLYKIKEISIQFFEMENEAKVTLKKQLNFMKSDFEIQRKNYEDLEFKYSEELKRKETFNSELRLNKDFKAELDKRNNEVKELKYNEKDLQELLIKKENQIQKEIKHNITLNETINDMKDLLNKKEQELKFQLNRENYETIDIMKKMDENNIENEKCKSKLISTNNEYKNIIDRMNNEINQLKNELKNKCQLDKEFKEIKEKKDNCEEKLKSLEKQLNEILKKNHEVKLNLNENKLKEIIEEKISLEDKLKIADSRSREMLKEKLAEKKDSDKEINDLKQQLTDEKKKIHELKKEFENEIKALNQRKKEEKLQIEIELKKNIDQLKEFKLKEENLRGLLEKLNIEKDCLIKVNEEQLKTLNDLEKLNKNPKIKEYIEKEKKNFEIQTNSLIHDNQEISKKNEELKSKYSAIKEDYDRMLKNSNRNDLLNRCNIIDRKFAALKKEYKHLKRSQSKLDKQTIIGSNTSRSNNSNAINEILNSSSSSDEKIIEEFLEKKIMTIKEGTTFIFSVFDCKRILRYDLEYRSFKLLEFADYAQFEDNFYPQGSIYLNISDGLLVISGENHDLFYQYNYRKNTFNKLNKLNYNHSYGGLIYYEKENSIICLSGWHNRRVEKYLSLDISFSFMKEIDKSKQKINLSNKNNWVNIPELKSERSECPYIIINNLYLYAFFGFNCPKMKYLETIERINLDTQDNWEYVKFTNEEHLSTYIKSHSLIKHNEEEILFVGGYDGKNESPVENFIFFNIKSNKMIGSQRKFPDIIKNHCYYFQKNLNFIPFIEDHNKRHFVNIDEKDNIHLIEIGSLQYDIFKFED